MIQNPLIEWIYSTIQKLEKSRYQAKKNPRLETGVSRENMPRRVINDANQSVQ